MNRHRGISSASSAAGLERTFKLTTYFSRLTKSPTQCGGYGAWSFLTTCTTHDGPFSGTLIGDQLKLRLRPDEAYETTFDLTVRVLPGDSVLTGNLTVVAIGSDPLCFEDFASLRLQQGEVDGLPIGR